MHEPRLLAPLVVGAATASLTFGTPTAATQSPPEFLSNQVTVDGATYPYRLLTPPEVIDGERYPLVLFLHGAGERGDDNEAQLRHLPERMATAAYRDRYPCFVLAPQCPRGERWADAEWGATDSTPMTDVPARAMRAAIAALAEVVRTQPIDHDRIMLTGLSMGGYGTWDLAARHPDWFSAAAPICGGGDERAAARLAGLPLSVWHGNADRLVPVVRSRAMVKALRAVDAPVEYHELEGVGHNAWVQAYDEGGCLDDLSAARRDTEAGLSVAARLAAAVLAPDERVAFLGDSITQSGNQPGGYVDRLRTLFRRAQPDIRVIPAGISGHRVPDLLARFRADVVDQNATLVFLYIGINDVWHSQSGHGTPAEEYEAGLRKLVREMRASGAEVVLATPSVIGERAAGTNVLDAMLDTYAAISRRVADEEGATLCDLHRAFVEHLAVFNPADLDRGVLTTDGVHLNAAGNVFVATEAARALRVAAQRR